MLTRKGCQAQVIQHEHKGLRVIDIAVTGDVKERQHLLRKVRDEIEAIHHEWFKNIDVDQMVPCDCAECVQATEPSYFSWDDLRKALKKSADKKIECRTSFERVSVTHLLEGVFEPDELSKPDQQLDVGAGSSTVNIHNEIVMPERRLDPEDKVQPSLDSSSSRQSSSDSKDAPKQKSQVQKIVEWFNDKVVAAAIAGLLVVWLAYLFGWS